MARKQKIADKKGEDVLVKTLKILFKKEYPELVPFTRGGVRLFNYIFDATRAAEKVGVPKGFKVMPVELETFTVRGKQEVRVAEIIGALIEEALKPELPNLPESNVHYSGPVLTADPQTSVVYDKVKAIIIDQLGIDPTEITPMAKFVEDLGADSLDTVELTMELETAFNIEIPDEDAEKLFTVQHVVNYLEKDLKNFDLVKVHECKGIV